MLNAKRLWTTAILLGVAFDLLFWKKTPGISFAIFVALTLFSGIRVLAEDGIRPHRRSLWLLLPIGFFSAMTFVRAEPLTVFLNVTLTLVFMAFFTLTFLGGRWLWYSLGDNAAGFFRLAGNLLGNGFAFIIETRKQREQAEAESAPRRFWPILRGLLIALPIVAIFASILSSADLIFAQRMEDFVALFQLEKLPEYIFRGFYIMLIAYLLTGAFIYAARKSRDEKLIGEEKPALSPFLGFTESSIVLGSVLLLFAFFVALQFRYFFGGQANIHLDGYTYAEYARKGFGELVTVAIFSLMLFLGLTSITHRKQPAQQKTFSGLGIALVGLTLIILVSAFQRLTLYETAYGFSRLRAYPHVFMIWLGALLIAVVVLEILGRQRAFAPALAFATIGFAVTLNLLNVDAFIVRQNIARSRGGAALDMAYLAALSDDAVPALAAALGDASLSARTREAVGAALLCHQDGRANRSEHWQSFHLADWTATRIQNALESNLAAYAIDDNDWQLRVIAPSGVEFDCNTRFIWD